MMNVSPTRLTSGLGKQLLILSSLFTPAQSTFAQDVKIIHSFSQINQTSVQALSNWLWFGITALLFVLVFLFPRARIYKRCRCWIEKLKQYLVRKLDPDKKSSFSVHTGGKEILINSDDVLYAQAAGNYIEIQERTGKHVIRGKIGEFDCLVPDKMQYVRIHRSYIVRIDKIRARNSKSLMVGDVELPIGKTYKEEIAKLAIGY